MSYLCIFMYIDLYEPAGLSTCIIKPKKTT